jgi:hypothetical protein
MRPSVDDRRLVERQRLVEDGRVERLRRAR